MATRNSKMINLMIKKSDITMRRLTQQHVLSNGEHNRQPPKAARNTNKQRKVQLQRWTPTGNGNFWERRKQAEWGIQVLQGNTRVMDANNCSSTGRIVCDKYSIPGSVSLCMIGSNARITSFPYTAQLEAFRYACRGKEIRAFTAITMTLPWRIRVKSLALMTMW